MTHEPIIRASREAFGHEPDPIEACPFSPWLGMALGALTVAAQLGVIAFLAWGML